MMIVGTHPTKDKCCCPEPFIFFVHRWWCLLIVLFSVILFRLLLFCLLGNQPIPGRENIGGMASVTASTRWPDRDGVMPCSLYGFLTDAALSLVKVIVHLYQGLWLVSSSNLLLQLLTLQQEQGDDHWQGSQPWQKGLTGSICLCQSKV